MSMSMCHVHAHEHERQHVEHRRRPVSYWQYAAAAQWIVLENLIPTNLIPTRADSLSPLDVLPCAPNTHTHPFHLISALSQGLGHAAERLFTRAQC